MQPSHASKHAGARWRPAPIDPGAGFLGAESKEPTMKNIYHRFSVTCPFCHLSHIWISEIEPECPAHLIPRKNHILCCGYEIGFSVRRLATTPDDAAVELLRAAEMVVQVWQGTNDFDTRDSERALKQAIRKMQEVRA